MCEAVLQEVEATEILVHVAPTSYTGYDKVTDLALALALAVMQ